MDTYPPSQTGYYGQNSQHNGNLPLQREGNGVWLQPSVIDATASRSDTYGDMPLEMLMAKFEETAGEDTDYAYNDYARNLMIDRRPDAVAFEWERPRSGTNATSAMIQFRQTGHRGEAEYGHPELMLGFTEGDQRGTTTDPDLNKMRDQSLLRGRFQRFDPDDTQSITGGGQNEMQIQEAKVRGYTDLRGRLKVFSRTLDGRTPTLAPTFGDKSVVGSVQGEDAGDDRMIGTQYGQTRSPAILIGKMIRDTAEYRTTTLDSDLKIAKYGQVCGRTPAPSRRNARTALATADVSGESDASQTRKVKSVLLTQMLAARRSVGDQQDATMFRAEVLAKSNIILSADWAKAMAATRTEGDFSSSDQSVLLKTAPPTPNNFRGIGQVVNHIRPSHEALKEVLAYKTAKGDSKNIGGEAIVELRTDAGNSVFGRNLVDPAAQNHWMSVGDYYTEYVSRDVPSYKKQTRVARSDGATAPIVTDYLGPDVRRSQIYTQGTGQAHAGTTRNPRYDQDPWDSVAQDRSGGVPRSVGVSREGQVSLNQSALSDL